jgi:dihydropyrimidinase
MTTLIKNGTIVTATDTYKADILVKNGVITEIGSEISKIASEIIDAAERLVLPGAVDIHTHLDTLCDGMTTVDDFETGTAAAAAGGTTTVVDYAEQTPGASLAQVLEEWKTKAGPRAIIDYGFHLALSEVHDGILAEIPAMVEAGVTSFKVSLDGSPNQRIGDAALLEFLQRTAAAGALACVHAENGEVIDLLVRRLSAEGKTTARSVAAGRPPELEGESVGRVIALAELAKAPVYLTNLSSAHAMEKVKAARDRGQAVYAETCPHYLVLASDRYEETEGIKYYATPPLRPAWHQEVLWKALGSGDVHTVGSDHTAFNFAGQKDAGKENFLKAPRGLPGIQERLSVVHGAGVQAGRISANRMVDLLSATPAKLFGMFPRKGTLTVGSDADMVIFDPRTEQTLSKSIGLSRTDYCAFEGIRVRGVPWLVLQRGRVIAREGKVMGRPGSGEYLSRSKFAAI